MYSCSCQSKNANLERCARGRIDENLIKTSSQKQWRDHHGYVPLSCKIVETELKESKAILYAGYNGVGGLVKEEVVANAYACRHTHTSDFIVGTLTDLWDRMWKQMQYWKKSWMVTGEDFNYFDTYEMEWFQRCLFLGKVKSCLSTQCQANTRNKPFFNAERNYGSVSRPSEWRSGLLLLSVMKFWSETD